ncbi:Conserved protein of unknown function [Mycobacterium canettii CIPT 140070017]|nr:Conserved protein of unknown function [Mycobacterium canettii CIPT 140070017]
MALCARTSYLKRYRMRYRRRPALHAMTVARHPGKPNCVSRTAISSRKLSLASGFALWRRSLA